MTTEPSLAARQFVAAMLDRDRQLAKILADLDRCEHGRHAADKCLSCPDGWSTGNLLMPRPGQPVGHDLYGEPYVMPRHRAGQTTGDPAAWRRQPCSRDTDGDGGCGQRHCPECGRE